MAPYSPLCSRENPEDTGDSTDIAGSHHGLIPDAPRPLDGNAERIAVPLWNLTKYGNSVIAVAASDDHDKSGYLDYVITGGVAGSAHIWAYDTGDSGHRGSSTYRLFAKLNHATKRAKPKMTLREGIGYYDNAVMAVCAAPLCALTGLLDGRLFVWPLRESREKANDYGMLENLPALSQKELMKGCKSRPISSGCVLSIEMVGEEDSGRFVVFCEDKTNPIQIILVERGDDIAITLQSSFSAGSNMLTSVCYVAGDYTKDDLIAACGIRQASALVSDDESPRYFLKLWKLAEDPSEKAVEVADVDIPMQESPANLEVSEVRNDFGKFFQLDELREVVNSDGLVEKLREKGCFVDEENISSDKVFKMLRQLLKRISEQKSIAYEPPDDDDVDELLLALGLRAYSERSNSANPTNLPWQMFLETLEQFPEQLCVISGRETVFSVELKALADCEYSLNLLHEHHTEQEAAFLALDTVGRHAATTSSEKCTVWRLDDFVQQTLEMGARPSKVNQLALRVPKIELENRAPVSSIWVGSTARGEKGGENDQLLCGLNNGAVCIWDMFGDTGGEIVADLRSASWLTEILMPPVLELITFVQLTSFAFNKAIPWHRSTVAEARKVGHYAHFDLSNAVMDLDFDISREMIFWAEVLCTLIIMLTFILWEFCGGQEILLNRMRYLQGSSRFAKEHLEMEEAMQEELSADDDGQDEELGNEITTHSRTTTSDMPARRSSAAATTRTTASDIPRLVCKCRFAHARIASLRTSVHAINFIIKLGCTICVVPLAKYAAKMWDCDYDKDGDFRYVASAPQIRCFQDKHLILCVVSAIIVPIFFFILVPFCVCGGDATYVQRDELLSFSKWQGNAERKAGVYYMGFMHPVRGNFYRNQLASFFVKVLIPVIEIETTRYPLLRGGLLLLVATLIWLQYIWKPPMVSGRATSIMQGAKALTAFSFLCAIYAVYKGDEEDKLPGYILIAGTFAIAVIVLIVTCFQNNHGMTYKTVVISSNHVFTKS